MSEDQILQLLEAYTTFTVQACAGTGDDRTVMNKWGNEMYLKRFTDFAKAIRALTIAEFEYLGTTIGFPEGFIEALHRQRRLDEDGEEVGVSRCAVDTAIELLERFAQSDRQKTNEINLLVKENRALKECSGRYPNLRNLA